MNKVKILGISLGSTFYIGFILLGAFIFLSMTNYIYKKYRKRVNNSENLFNVSNSKETFISILDVLILDLILIALTSRISYTFLLNP